MQTEWHIGGDRVFQPGTYIAGVLNVTPNSFYDGGLHQEREAAIARAREILTQGADILDVGGESTRPYSERVDRDEELERVLPVLRTIRSEFPDRPVSVDTYKAETARQALDSGAAIVNDVTACGLDPELTDVLVQYQPGYVLMHSQGRPEDMQKDPRYRDPVEDIAAFLEAELDRLVRSGLQEERIVIDPGIGFGKSVEHNLRLMWEIPAFRALARPVLIGPSRKSFIGKLSGVDDPQERVPGTSAAVTVCVLRGADVVRVHDVKELKQAVDVATGFFELSACNPVSMC